MRTFFGAPQDALLYGTLGVLGVVVLALGITLVRQPLLARLALRNLPRRPGLAVLITLGLTLGTIILSTAFTTGDTMAFAIRSVVAGALGSADEVVFVPSDQRENGFDVAQAIASGTLLAQMSAYMPQSDTDRVVQLLANDPSVAAVVPADLEQAAVAGNDTAFQAEVVVLGVPPDVVDGQGLIDAPDGTPLPLASLAPDEVYVNSEAASSLGLKAGDTAHLYGLSSPGSDQVVQVRAVARLGDLGGGQATVFLPLSRLQEMDGHTDDVNQVLILNSGTPSQRLQESWPVVVTLRNGLLDPSAAQRLYQVLATPTARQTIETAAARSNGAQADKLRQLAATLTVGEPTPAFTALVQDPDVIGPLAALIPGGRQARRSGPLSVAGGARFSALDVQQIAQDQADQWGSAFTNLFVVLGLFSLASGVLLIVLIFSLLALARRGELAVMRALGGRRRDVVLLVAVEGGLYSLISGVFGLVGGVALAYGLISFASALVAQYGFRLQPTVQPGSVVISYALGVLLTFVSVTVTAWRSSRLSITRAIRDLPEPPNPRPGVRWLIGGLLPLVVGAVLIPVGVQRGLSLGYAGGVVLALIGCALVGRWVVRRLGARGWAERALFSLAGAALIGWWLVPPVVLRALHVPVFPPTLELSFLSGLSMLLGAVWLIAYNMGLLRALRGRVPLWRVSVAYLAVHRFRTGLTLAMFGLVVLSLTLGTTLLSVTAQAYGDPVVATGGWDVRGRLDGPPRDVQPDLAQSPAAATAQVSAIGATGVVPVRAIQLGTSAPAIWQPTNVTVVDQGFTQGPNTPLVASSGDPGSAWQTLTQHPGTAIVGAGLLQTANGFRVSAQQGQAFRPVTLWVRDARGIQTAIRLQVIGLADARGPFGSAILAGDETFAAWPAPTEATYDFSVAPNASVEDVTAALNVAVPGLQAIPIRQDLRLVEGLRGLLQMILDGFMGIGLLAGVVALGVISLHAVVERRAQMGLLRSLGFAARSVGLGLMLESGVVALLGSLIGVGVGLAVARGTVEILAQRSPELQLAIPWGQLGVIVLAALVASLLMIVLPARQAARVAPAQALREGV